ncbi:hypothetical protein Poli38472_009357 [Pythium oligandrum]|uniref:Uncharacterized protein n=1 Tax=Pythium oligandrum TaxID=41045 RepID=A0A8K1FIN7_PYTOL|nr:hypothetical protein Poli38472_009357 [Pythium oligandrum]|eukprot:TMW65190.1 hypothetical protein Poli38472_009357 [Pythium oligandrum]
MTSTHVVTQHELYRAAAHGDLVTVQQFFYQSSVAHSIDRINAWYRGARVAALAATQVPYAHKRPQDPPSGWYVQLGLPISFSQDFLFGTMTKHGHTHVLAWLFSREATEIIGDTLRGVMHRITMFIMYAPVVSLDMMESLVTSHLFVDVMTPEEQQHALADALNTAIRERRHEMVRTLVAHGARVEGTPRHEAPLMVCAGYGDAACLQVLVDHGVDLLSADVFVEAASKGNVDGAKSLVAHGADASGEPGTRNPLHVAAEEGVAAIVDVLLTDERVDINAQTASGSTALMLATRKRRMELQYGYDGPRNVVSSLLRRGADLSLQDVQGRTALHHAACSEYLEVVSLLLGKGADPNTQDTRGATPLHAVAQKEMTQRLYPVLDLLLSHGADAFLETQDGSSAYKMLLSGGLGRIMSRRYSPDAPLSRNQARTWVYRKCGADIDRALSWVDKTKAKTMLEMTTVDRSAILGATSRGDLNTIRSHFRQPVVMESIADINRRLLPAYATKLRANETPFIDYTRLSGRRSWLQELLLNQPAKGDHAHVFE